MKNALPFALLGATLLLTACEDPSNVGVGLIGEEGGEPVVERVDLAAFDSTGGRDVTGNTALVLAGRVDDPLLGTLAATGYLDFSAVGAEDLAGFRDTTLASATLQLVPDYVYGDTTGTVTLELRSVAEEVGNAEAASASADTTLPAGELITSFSFPLTDTLVSVPLPAAWVAAKDTTLRSERATSVFHGFQIAPAPGDVGTVVGFDRSESRLRAIAGADTVFFGEGNNGVKAFSSLERTGEVALPPDRVLLQDGIGPRLRLDLDLETSDLLGNALNRAEIRLYPDTLALDGSATLHRPRPPVLLLYAVEEDGSEFLSAVGELRDEGYYAFSDASGSGGGTVQVSLRTVLQRDLLGDPFFDHFEIAVPSSFNTLNPLLFYGAGADETAPRAVLTLTESGA